MTPVAREARGFATTDGGVVQLCPTIILARLATPQTSADPADMPRDRGGRRRWSLSAPVASECRISKSMKSVNFPYAVHPVRVPAAAPQKLPATFSGTSVSRSMLLVMVAPSTV